MVFLEGNYLKKCGEIDLIMKSKAQNTTDIGYVIHFVEVKTVSYETKEDLRYAVTHETWRPEEQVHAFKLKKLYRTIELWLMEHEYEGDWQIDVVAVRLVTREKYASVKYIDNVVEG